LYQALMLQKAQLRQHPRLVSTLAMGLSKYLWNVVRLGKGSASRLSGLPVEGLVAIDPSECR
jgi:hypothetical protein